MDIATLFHSSRLVYRAVEDSDAAFMHQIQSDIVSFAASDSGLLKPMTIAESTQHKDFVKNKTLLGVIISLKMKIPPTAPPGTRELDPIPIGSMYLTAPRPGEEHHRNAYISIDIIRAYQGMGYGSEAIEWIVRWGFTIAGLHRIGIECYSYNEGAEKLYQKLGFVFEGRKRESLWFNGGWYDYLSFGMLETEWRKSAAEAKSKVREEEAGN